MNFLIYEENKILFFYQCTVLVVKGYYSAGVQDMSSHHHPLPQQVKDQSIPQASVRPLVRPLSLSPGRHQQQQQQQQQLLHQQSHQQQQHLHQGGGRSQLSPGGLPPGRSQISPGGGGSGHEMISPGGGRPCHTPAGCHDPLSPDRKPHGSSPDKELTTPSKTLKNVCVTVTLFFFPT
jgi:hypothetical protein